MTVNEFIKQLKKLDKDLKKKHIQIQAPNGLLMNPEIKFVLKDGFDVLNKSADNVQCIVITH